MKIKINLVVNKHRFTVFVVQWQSWEPCLKNLWATGIDCDDGAVGSEKSTIFKKTKRISLRSANYSAYSVMTRISTKSAKSAAFF